MMDRPLCSSLTKRTLAVMYLVFFLLVHTELKLRIFEFVKFKIFSFMIIKLVRKAIGKRKSLKHRKGVFL